MGGTSISCVVGCVASRFQALFCWIDGGEPMERASSPDPPSVSSLVLLDRWGGTLAVHVVAHLQRVSSLVLLDRWGGTSPPKPALRPRCVSSLVLLDRWGGTLSRAVGSSRPLRRFQALFCWIDGGNTSLPSLPSSPRSFQALFCWIDGGEQVSW